MNIPNIVILDDGTINHGDLSWESLSSLGNIFVYPRTLPEETLIRMADADIVLTSKVCLTEEIIQRAPRLKMICVLATGYNNVDIDCARSKGIVISNIPAYSSRSVAQHTVALLLALAELKAPATPLKDRTLGIIGYGNISKHVLPIASAFGMKIIISSRYPDHSIETDRLSFTSLEKVLANSDFISLHCPLDEENRGFINKKSIDIMKDGIMLINTSRGGLINSNSLADAVKSGKVGGAALDVLESEPPEPSNPLIGLPGVLLTPHMAWSGLGTRKKLIELAVSNVKGFLEGKPINVI